MSRIIFTLAQELLAASADPNARDKQGFTAMHYAGTCRPLSCAAERHQSFQ